MRNKSNIVARTRAALHLSQQDLADHTNLSRLQIIRFEQSIPPKLSPALSAYFSTHLPTYSANGYENYYAEERLARISDFRRNLTTSEDYDVIKKRALDYALDTFMPTIAIKGLTSSAYANDNVRVSHPFCLARTYLFEHYGLPVSQIKFCQYTGAHPATISAIERGKISLGDSPAIREMLTSVLNFTTDEVALLEKMCDQCL